MSGYRRREEIVAASNSISLMLHQPDPVETHQGSLFLRSLPSHDLRRLVPYLRLRDVAREEALHHEGAMIRSIAFPHDVTVSLVSFLEDGTPMEIATVGTEGFVGVEVMLGSAVADSAAVTQQGRVSVIALDRLLILVDQVPSLRPAMLSYACRYVAMITRLVACNALHSLRQRACRRLLLAADQAGQRALMMTQEELARALGVGRTSVNQACKELRESGIIEYRRGRIQVTDPRAMTDAACECYPFLRRTLSL